MGELGLGKAGENWSWGELWLEMELVFGLGLE